ncbi:MAG: hypothetical protein WC314_24620 [Vulcanimicrobiota bacterium]
MNISSTKRTLSPHSTRAAVPQPRPEEQAPRDSLSGILVHRFATQPMPKQSKLGVILPALGGAAVGASCGLIGEGLGAGASIPGIAILGLAGAALGSKIDGKDGSKWTKILAATGAVVGAAGVVAGAVGGTAGAIAGGVSLAGTGFAMGHLFQHFTE